MQLKIALAGIALAGVAVTAGACGGDGPSIWSSGLAASGGGGSGSQCSALQACCTELATKPSAEGASCNGAVPDDETTCESLLELFESTGSCTDVPIPAGSSADAGGSTSGSGTGTSSAYACNVPLDAQCMVFFNSTDPAEECSIADGTPAGTTCPTSELTGCCKPAHVTGESTEMCYYAGTPGSFDATTIMGFCQSSQGTFSTTP